MKLELKPLFHRAIIVLREEGLSTLLEKIGVILNRFLDVYYCYRHVLRDLNEREFLPELENFEFKVIFSNQQVDEMEEQDYIFRSAYPLLRSFLISECIATCIFVDKKLVNIGWIGITKKAADKMGRAPYYINFLKKEACLGMIYTLPDYRNKGFSQYNHYKQFQLLKEKGIKTVINACKTDNIAVQKVNNRFNPSSVRKKYYIVMLIEQICRDRVIKK